MKQILVTGANKGIGFAVCRRLLQEHTDVKVLLGSRDAARGQAAVKELEKEYGANGRVQLVVMDTSDKESIQKAADSVSGPLYGLVNNAGIGFGLPQDVTLATNYWGVRNTVDAFLPKMKKNKGRIVMVASASAPGFVEGLDENDPLKAKLGFPWNFGGIQEVDSLAKTYELPSKPNSRSVNAYGLSKALLNAYMYLLARQEQNFIINSLTPGFIATDLTAGFGATKTPWDGAGPVLHCLFDETVASSPQGRYYGSDCKRSPMHMYRDPGDPEYDGPDGP